jgi:hypothetical protein
VIGILDKTIYLLLGRLSIVSVGTTEVKKPRIQAFGAFTSGSGLGLTVCDHHIKVIGAGCAERMRTIAMLHFSHVLH